MGIHVLAFDDLGSMISESTPHLRLLTNLKFLRSSHVSWGTILDWTRYLVSYSVDFLALQTKL
jgi:hypothetical protein